MAKGLTQEALADAAGVNRPYVSHLEQQKYAVSLRKLEVIAKALGVKASVLIDEDLIIASEESSEQLAD
jgi:transcriptional regulator with XRE-family HTH domain